MSKITWLLYHEPVDLFLRTANAFAKEIAELTNNRIEIEIYTVSEYSQKFKNGAKIDPVKLIESGEVQMSQLQVNRLAFWHTPDFFALDLPFLFRDHDHASKVLDGEIGQSMLAGLAKKSPVRGLAFTYSGGYRVVAADKEIRTVEDLKDLKIMTRLNPVEADTAEAFGCISTVAVPEDVKYIESNAVQTTLPRYEAEANSQVHKYVVNTKHSMYLTSIIVSKEFWNGLSLDDQTAMQTAALNSARLERIWSVEDADKISSTVEEQKRLGIQSFSELSDLEIKKLKMLTNKVYEKYSPFFTEGLITSIINA
jgi:TRAP-type C4-dicarboxylate transport system substrate-binding protein